MLKSAVFIVTNTEWPQISTAATNSSGSIKVIGQHVRQSNIVCMVCHFVVESMLPSVRDHALC